MKHLLDQLMRKKEIETQSKTTQYYESVVAGVYMQLGILMSPTAVTCKDGFICDVKLTKEQNDELTSIKQSTDAFELALYHYLPITAPPSPIKDFAAKETKAGEDQPVKSVIVESLFKLTLTDDNDKEVRDIIKEEVKESMVDKLEAEFKNLNGDTAVEVFVNEVTARRLKAMQVNR